MLRSVLLAVAICLVAGSIPASAQKRSCAEACRSRCTGAGVPMACQNRCMPICEEKRSKAKP
jgi:hypothetical protein